MKKRRRSEEIVEAEKKMGAIRVVRAGLETFFWVIQGGLSRSLSFTTDIHALIEQGGILASSCAISAEIDHQAPSAHRYPIGA